MGNMLAIDPQLQSDVFAEEIPELTQELTQEVVDNPEIISNVVDTPTYTAPASPSTFVPTALEADIAASEITTEDLATMDVPVGTPEPLAPVSPSAFDNPVEVKEEMVLPAPVPEQGDVEYQAVEATPATEMPHISENVPEILMAQPNLDPSGAVRGPGSRKDVAVLGAMALATAAGLRLATAVAESNLSWFELLMDFIKKNPGKIILFLLGFLLYSIILGNIKLPPDSPKLQHYNQLQFFFPLIIVTGGIYYISGALLQTISSPALYMLVIVGSYHFSMIIIYDSMENVLESYPNGVFALQVSLSVIGICFIYYISK